MDIITRCKFPGRCIFFCQYNRIKGEGEDMQCSRLEESYTNAKCSEQMIKEHSQTLI